MHSPRNYLTIVSGLPRSGTSLMMRMLAAGGIPLLADTVRPADEDNPRGYFEFEPVKRTRDDATWVPAAVGRAVKMIHVLLADLPLDQQYRVIFMRRHLDEVIRSQDKMLRRHGKSADSLPPDVLKHHFEAQIAATLGHLRDHPRQFRVLEVDYNLLVNSPAEPLAQLCQFLDGLDTRAMQQMVDPQLYRNRLDPHSGTP